MMICFALGTASLALSALRPLLKDIDTNISIPKDIETMNEISYEEYVSLPVLDSLEITENQKTAEQADESTVLGILLEDAKISDSAEDECTVMADITILKNENEIKKKEDVPIGLSNTENTGIPEELLSALSDCKKGDILTVGPLEEYEGAKYVDIKVNVKEIYQIPYPVTDEYMTEHTEYKSFQEMINRINTDRQSEVREKIRGKTLSKLLDEAISRTTFLDFPSSLCKKEYEILREEDSEATYSDAKESLKKIFFLASMIKKYDLATEEEINSKVSEYCKINNVNLSGYERERVSYMLFEDRVTNLLYKKAEIVTTQSGKTKSQ